MTTTTTTPQIPDPIPAPIQSLLAIFGDYLADVRFPDVDAEVLGGAADEVRRLAQEVARAEAVLEAARAALADGQEVLLARSQRALAYARIFAEDDAALSARLDGVGLPRAARRVPRSEPAVAAADAPQPIESATANGPRRGRPRKEAAPASLFAAPPIEAEPLANVG